MTDRDRDEMLRAMAQHRGLKLVKSRRRKPGGDFGRYGLSDPASGKPCFGFGDEGLTATADEIESYLRSSQTATWKRSLIAAVGAGEAQAPEPGAAKTRVGKSGKPAAKPSPKPRPRPAPPPPEPEPEPGPEPELVIREAAKGDARAIAALVAEFGAAIEARAMARRIAALAETGEPPLVADRAGIIGCVAWHVIPGLHRPPLGRITMIAVGEAGRRQGIGTLLLEAAEQRLRKRGCATIEVTSDIGLDDSHGFFRRAGYERTSYRFAKS